MGTYHKRGYPMISRMPTKFNVNLMDMANYAVGAEHFEGLAAAESCEWECPPQLRLRNELTGRWGRV